MLSKVVDSEKGELENQYNGLGFRVATTRPEERIEYLCDISRDCFNLLERTVNGETESFIYDKNVISMSKAGNSYYYLQDELGSPMYMTGTDGAAVSSYAFDDFGRGIDPFTGGLKEAGQKHTMHGYTTEGNIIQPFAFTGYQEDEVSGLMFAQARFYSTTRGRFQSEDRIKGYLVKPESINHYEYCLNDPRCRVDSNGNESYYIFYSETQFSGQAMSYYYDLISSGVDPNDIEMIGFDEDDTHEDFIREWNNMSDENITEVSVFLHSNNSTFIMPNANYGINDTGISSQNIPIGSFEDLERKNIDTIRLNTCNSGSDIGTNNISSELLRTQDVDMIYSWSGSVSYDIGLGVVYYPMGPYGALGSTIYYLRYTPRVSNEQHIDVEKKGQVCYFVRNGYIYYYFLDDPENIVCYAEVEECNE